MNIKILDTSVILEQKLDSIISNFQGVESETTIVIPLRVIEEIDRHKKGTEKRNENARHATRYLEELRLVQHLHSPIQIGENLFIMVDCIEEDINGFLGSGTTDMNLLQMAQMYIEEAPENNVEILCNDTNVRLITDIVFDDKVKSAPYLTYQQSTEMYSGRVALQFSDEEIQEFVTNKEIQIDEELLANQLIEIIDSCGSNIYGIYDAKNDKIKMLGDSYQAWGIKPYKNNNGVIATQKMLMNTLLDPSIEMITVAGVAGCVDCDTEFFNGTGWKKISEWTENEKILQYNQDGTAELVIPKEYHKYTCDTMWHFETKYGLDQCLSDEHNVWYMTSKNNLYHKTFTEVKQNQESTGFSGKFITTFDLINKSALNLSDNQIRLEIAIKADGTYAPNNSTRCAINIKKQYKKDRIKLLLKANGIKYKEWNKSNGFSVYLFDYKTSKIYEDSWYNCNKDQAIVIFDEIKYWDGSIKNNAFYTAIKTDADFIQFIGTSLGYRSTINTSDRRGRVKKTDGKEYITKSIEYKVSFTKKSLIGMNTDRRSDHVKTPINEYKTLDGYKYCFTTDSGMWIMRRNNRIVVTGNSGKTYLTLAAALEQTFGKNKLYDKILIMRPMAEADKEIGALPGSKIEKLGPWLAGPIDNLKSLLKKKIMEPYNPYSKVNEVIEDLLTDDLIEFESFSFLRGRSLEKTFIIIDDFQNASKEQANLAITRAGQGSKIVFLGDVSQRQIDNPNLSPLNNGLRYLIDHMAGQDESIAHVVFSDEEVVRSKIAKLAVKLLP